MAPPSRPARLAVRVTGAALGCVIALTACSGSPSEKRPRKVARLTFANDVTVIRAAGDGAGGDEYGREIVQMITDWYQQAFVDPSAWKDRKFPNVVARFTGSAREQVVKEIDSVTIGKAAPEIFAVEPTDASVKVTVYVDAEGAPKFAVADVRFAATGAMREEGPPLSIVQTGVYHLRREGSEWKIFAYNARSEQVQRPPSPSGSSS